MQIRTPRTAILVVQLVCNAVSQALEAKKLELSFYCMDRPSTSHHQHTPASHGMHAMLTPSSPLPLLLMPWCSRPGGTAAEPFLKAAKATKLSGAEQTPSALSGFLLTRCSGVGKPCSASRNIKPSLKPVEFCVARKARTSLKY